MSDNSELDLIYSEQFRATELQVFNWGTFQRIHRMAIAQEGHLIIGASGAGKSSLLDAIATILVPLKWHDLNAAARDQERKGKDRSVASYVRGAFSQGRDDDTGEITTRFLRPEATWSALALCFDNGRGKIVTLAQLLWIRGSGTKNADVKHLHFIFDRAFAIEEFGSFDLDPRKIKRVFPDAFCDEDFSPYQERFMRELGIEGENALKLLHKTQSAKNLGDLNSFMRDFMLDQPSTFEAAQSMVEEFGRLDEAHRALIEARKQIDLLRPAREDLSELADRQAESSSIEDTLTRMDEWVSKRMIALYTDESERLRIEESKLNNSRVVEEDALLNERRFLGDLETRYREVGGTALDGWKRELEDLIDKRKRQGNSIETLRRCAHELGRNTPETPEGFAELQAEGRGFIESWQDPQGAQAARQAKRDVLRDEYSAIDQEAKKARGELESLKDQPSNIPSFFLGKRLELARRAGIQESSLPFIGELLQVRAGEEEWEGAIERVLRGFSLSLLVSEEDWPSLAREADANFLGFKLVYYRVPDDQAKSRVGPKMKDSLPGKLDIKEGRWTAWVANELDNRFSYACVESVKGMGDREKAVTKAGQIKHGKNRFEKNDQYRIDDKREWTLGFRNDAKIELYRNRLGELDQKARELSVSIRAIEMESTTLAGKVAIYGRLSGIEWRDIELRPTIERIASIEQSIAEATRKDGDLADLERQLSGQRDKVAALEKQLVDTAASAQAKRHQIADIELKARCLKERAVAVHIPETTVARIEELFSSDAASIELDTLGGIEKRVRNKLGARKEALVAELERFQSRIIVAFRRYKETWPVEGGDLDASLSGASEFMARLDKLELEDLPAHEARFAAYLKEQSYKHLSELSTRIERNRRDIRKRMEIVNESLAQVKFGAETTLHIETVDRKIREVQEFNSSLREIQEHALDDDEAESERRFTQVRGLIERLRSAEGSEQRWRELVLDVRNHVEFIAHEVNEAGERIQSYRSGAGKSGGQRQRLATTCLAAALRYQLGGAKQGLPRFAMVSMDEAFDKADTEFTSRIMEIFKNFGFQMIMATPNKAVMSLEPFIGGACYVGIKDERDSRLLPILIDKDTGRLEIFVHGKKKTPNAQET